MTRYRLLAFAVLAASCPLVALGQTESEFYATPKTAPEFWRATRFELRTGSYERAAERIKGLLDLNPDDKTLFELVDKPGVGNEGGMAQFLRLRNVPRWNAKDGPNKEAKARVEELIAKVTKAMETELGNPERIRRFALALAGPEEEATFALNELRRSGKLATPVLVAMLDGQLQDDQRTAILAAIPQLGQDTVPGLVAFLPAAKPQVQAELIDSLRARSDFKGLDVMAETDVVPTLWYLLGQKDATDAVKKKAKDSIEAATGKDPSLERDPDLRTPQGQLTAYAKKFANDKSNLKTLVGDAKHNIWVFDGKTLKETPMTQAQATEFYGLRYARWALDLQPDYAPAQKAFFTIAIEQHALSGGGQSLAKTAPELHAALVTAPFGLLADLLEESMRDKRTSVVLAVVRVLAERSEAKAAHTRGQDAAKDTAEKEKRPSLLVKALDYPNPRVQFAAADALLRIPGPATHRRQSQIVKILAAALAAEPEDGAKQKALIADPDAARADGLALVLKRGGFDVEVLRTGRQLLKRIQEKADADLVFVDRHVVDPLLVDFLPQYRADFRAKNLPLLVLASPEGATPVNLLTALARLASVLAFEDLPKNPYVALPEVEAGAKMQDIVEKVPYPPDQMRTIIYNRHLAQVALMKDLAGKAGFSMTPELEDRIEYFSLQTFPFYILDTFVKSMLDQERIILMRLLPALQREEAGDNPSFALKSKIKTDGLPSKEQAERIVRLMKLTGDREAELPADRLPQFNRLWDSFWDVERPKLPPMEPIRHPEIEAALNRVVAPYKNVRVIPAVFSDVSFKEALTNNIDPKTPMITPEEKKANAKTALVWLRRIATGELAGYRANEAEVALRGALKNDEFAPLAIDALVRFPSKDVQLDLGNLVVAPNRPVPVRSQAASALVEHVQAFGRFVTDPQVDAISNAIPATEDLDLKAKLLAVQGILKTDAKGTGDRLKNYVPKPAAPPPMKEDAPPKEKEEVPAKDKQ